jgi:hypothetical protein
MRIDYYRYKSNQGITHVTDWGSTKADMFKAYIAIRSPQATSLCVCTQSETFKYYLLWIAGYVKQRGGDDELSSFDFGQTR